MVTPAARDRNAPQQFRELIRQDLDVSVSDLFAQLSQFTRGIARPTVSRQIALPIRLPSTQSDHKHEQHNDTRYDQPPARRQRPDANLVELLDIVQATGQAFRCHK